MGSLVKKYSQEKLKGQIFTPSYIVDKILDDAGYQSAQILGKTIIDPACGDGRFLLRIADRIIDASPKEMLAENLSKIHGWDTDKNAVKQAIANLNTRISKFNIVVNWNISTQNALENGRNENLKQKYDFVVGNPPYIRIQHLQEAERKFMQQNYAFCQSGSTDIYIAFYELAHRLLKPNGVCGFITPNTFFQTETAKRLRNFFEKEQNLIQITNYGHLQLFDNATTYSAIVIFNRKKNKDFIFQQAITKNKFKQRIIPFKEIKSKKFWQLSTEKQVIVKGKRLGDIADIHVGITTLADKLYILSLVKTKKNTIILQNKEGKLIEIEKGILKPIIKVSTLKNVDAPIDKYIIFPYQTKNEKTQIIPENELKKTFPLAYKYLKSVKKLLEKRDNGKPNPVAWYAFGRSQGLQTSFGKKILFSPMNKKPNFMFSDNQEASFYSGYCIKYEGDNQKLLEQLNSERMQKYMQLTARDFRGGWKAYNKKIVQEFIIFD